MRITAGVFLNVNDLEKSLALYGALGFEVENAYEDEEGQKNYVDLKLGDAELSLGRIGANDDPEFRAWVSTPLGAGVMVTFNVPDVDAFYERAKSAGAEIEAPLSDRPYGRAFSLNDPDGYSILFIRPT